MSYSAPVFTTYIVCCQSISLDRVQRSLLFAFTLSKSNEFTLLIEESSGCIYTKVQSIYALRWLGLHQASEKWWGVILCILLPFRAVEILSLHSGSAFNIQSHWEKRVPLSMQLKCKTSPEKQIISSISAYHIRKQEYVEKCDWVDCMVIMQLLLSAECKCSDTFHLQ